VAGLVLTTGSIPLQGVVGLSPSLDTLGLLAATTADLYTAWAAVFAGPRELNRAVHEHATAEAGPRLLVWHPCQLGRLDEAMSAALVGAASRLAAAGGRMTPLTRGAEIVGLADDHATVMAYEAACERRAELDRADELSEPLVELLRRGERLSGAEYGSARRRIEASRTVIAALLADHDAVLGPAALGPAPEGLGATGTPVLSRPWQALGLPVVTIPGLKDRHGLPLGLQLIGRRNSEERLLRLSMWIERVLTS
jgi:Asp-tRNA(Asn)/Glu-tRNA(Gln) amidotransferase A subunit family amidase